MSDTTIKEPGDRTSALDEFAASMRMPEASTLPIVYPIHQAPQESFHGQLPPHPRPRDDRLVRERLRFAAAAAGEEFMYRFPVKNKRTGGTDFIEGPSIKLANELMRIYGNAEIETRVVDQGDSWLIYARFIDLETGYSRTRPFQQRKSAGKIGGMDDARRQEMALAMGVSKAERNVIVNSLQLLADYTFEEAKGSLIDKIGKNLVGWRDKIVDRLKARVDIARVEAVVGRATGAWTAPDVARVFAMAKAVFEDGMATLDETFPPLDRPAETSPELDKITESVTPPASARAGDAADGVGSPPSADVEAAPATIPSTAGAAAPSSALYEECIDKMLQTALNQDLTSEERISIIKELEPVWLAQLAGDLGFVQEVRQTAIKVAGGSLKQATGAGKYLKGLIPKD